MNSERQLGMVLGVACGDALGTTLEFGPGRETGDLHTEIIGGGHWQMKPGAVTDDTYMTLGVLRGIAANPQAQVEDIMVNVGEEFVSWYQGREPGKGGVGFTCRTAIEDFMQGGDWLQVVKNQVDKFGDDAAGNGGLMRTAPVSIWYYSDSAQIAVVSDALTAMTHPHPLARWCSVTYNFLCVHLARGTAKKEAWQAACDDSRSYAPRLAPAAEIAEQRLANAGRKDRQSVRHKGGFCLDTFESALWSFMTTETAEDCIVAAVNLGGDTDTVGAVAGGLVGAFYGAGALPQRWLDRLDPVVVSELKRCLNEV